MHGATMYRARDRSVRPVVSHHRVGGVVSLLRVLRAWRAVPHAATAGASRPAAGVQRQGGAHAAAALPGAGELRHRHADC